MRTAREKEIHQQQIDYVRNSDITVEVVHIYGTVDIKREGETLIYLQGFEGEVFCTEATHLWNHYGDISQSEVNELLAYPYADIE